MKRFLLCGALCFSLSFVAFAKDPLHVVLVDKSKNEIHLAAYSDDEIKIQKTFHVTLGKAKGDKQVEKDLKTPEGVYFFTQRLRPPAIKKKFGVMALMMNYPNPVDKMLGKTGFDIMLHATDDPSRLKLDYDSEGCIVIDNPQIEDISKYVRIGLTPIVVYDELKKDFLEASYKPELRETFDHWLKAWNGKDLDGYIGTYADDFVYSGMDLKRYKAHKGALNKRYASINVTAKNIRYYYHPKYDVVSFTQVYESTLKGGGKGFRSTGTKILYFVKKDDQYKIVREAYTNFRED